MANRLTISTIGCAPAGGNPGTGQEAVDRIIEFWEGKFAQVLPDRPDLILVPECCDRFSMHNGDEKMEFLRNRSRQVADYFASVARDSRCYVAYPALRIVEDGTLRNSVELFDRDGDSMGFYNKNFPVICETEDDGVLCGRDAPLFHCDFGTVGCAICFDLNFDEIRKRYVESRPDVLLFASMYHGGLMQPYWAYACRTHLVTAINGSPSGILTPVGETIASSTNYFDFVSASVNLDCEIVHLDGNWEKIRAMREQYGPDVTVFDPGHLASVLITSESDTVTSARMVEEFEIERLDHYFDRSVAHRASPKNMAPESGIPAGAG